MTLQEKELLERFLNQLAAARPGVKDPEAEALIRDAVARQPDAAYLLVQRAIQLEQALQVTQVQAQTLQSELDQLRPAHRGGFLSDPTWGSSAPATSAQGAGNLRQAAPTARPPLSGAWSSGGLLGNIASTAAGVVAGSFLFQGIDRLLHHNDTSWAQGPNHAPQQGALEHNALLDDSHDTPPTDDADTFADTGDDSDFA
jgi:uncharacterized protein